MLEPLAKSKPCYKLLTDRIYGKTDWRDFLKDHLPEQHSTFQEKTGRSPKNDTLLVVVNLPVSGSKKDHFTPARWWARFLEDALRKRGLNSYGYVRVLATVPQSVLSAFLPKSCVDRKRIGTLTEALGMHAIEVASTWELETYFSWRGWKTIQTATKQVAERAAALNIVTPPNREFPRLERAPDLDRQAKGTAPSPYAPRVCLPYHKDLVKIIETSDATGFEVPSGASDPVTKKKILAGSYARSKLTEDNKLYYHRFKLAKMQSDLDAQTHKLARAAADPKETPYRLKVLDNYIGDLRSAYVAKLSATHYKLQNQYDNIVDDERLAWLSNHMGGREMKWESRVFEPLFINSSEVWPNGGSTGVVYFEPYEHPPALQKIYQLPTPDQLSAIERFYALLSILGTRGLMSVVELQEIIFPDWTTDQFVRAFPSIATFANRRIKPGSGPIPLSDPTSDPLTSYQENLEYDLSDIRLRTISAVTLAEIAIEYEKLEDKLDQLKFNKLLGGTMTTAQAGNEQPFQIKR